MSASRTYALTAVTMVAFAANSILCRLALRSAHIDPAMFTALRLASGALMLWAIVRFRSSERSGNWTSAFFLFGYAAAFSFAYVALTASTGALLLFGAVQATMILFGLWRGERFNFWQVVGFVLAVAGLVYLVLPGVTAPPLSSALLMLLAGVSWGGYSLLGRASSNAIGANAGNFARATLFALVMISIHLLARGGAWDVPGVLLALTSGAVASALGYSLWYTALRGLNSTRAATVQLSVPVLTATAGVLFLGERITARLVAASAVILGGIALVVLERRATPTGASGSVAAPAGTPACDKA